MISTVTLSSPCVSLTPPAAAGWEPPDWALATIWAKTSRCSIIAWMGSLGMMRPFQQDPAVVIRRDQQVHELLIRIVVEIELADVDGVAEAGPDELEVGLQALAFEVLGVAVPADADVGLGHHVHDRLDRGQQGAAAVDFQADLLPVVGGELAQLVERLADLLGRLGGGDALGQVVRLDLDAGGAAVVGQLDVLLGRFDLLAQLVRLRIVEREVGARADERHLAVGEAFLDLAPLGVGQVRLHFVGVLHPQLHAE